tara:strand:- start:3470 stop:3781 length:312 start_codon:yes stop_codon:yes gene_type:complete
MAKSTTTILTDTSGTVYADADAVYDAFTSVIGIIDTANAKIAEAVSTNVCTINSTLSASGSAVQIDREWSDDSVFNAFRATLDLDVINSKADGAGWTIQYVEA